ncbi:dehydrogenase/reductase SDR family member on chromosome X-like [Vespula squamosa]|uniref:Dehydrogenase/reductase SDR family member on chromosome X-like n=1 Tax=Vespula squamosa TaxID=30214 RepID=A0ABD2B1Q7_VESSQ
MLLIIASMCAFLFSCLYYYKPRINLYFLITIFYYNILYSIVAIQDVINDIVNAKSNKTALLPMPEKIAIVTGGSRGIGAVVTKMLLQCHMEVVIGKSCRTPAAGEKLISQIRESGITSGKAKVYKLDNASLESVKEFADQIKLNYNKIHILINNAGIMFTPYEETKDGFEQQWCVNYLSHFYLTALLLPLLKAGSHPQENSRVVNVSSCAHHIGYMQFDDINFKKHFNTYAMYGQSKLAQVISTKHLQNLFKEKQLGIQVYAVHPGIVNTDLFQHSYVHKMNFLNKYIVKNPEQGAMVIIYAATNDKIKEHGGIYINNCKETKVNPIAFDKSVQEKLFHLSLEQVQLKDFFEYIDI